MVEGWVTAHHFGPFLGDNLLLRSVGLEKKTLKQAILETAWEKSNSEDKKTLDKTQQKILEAEYSRISVLESSLITTMQNISFFSTADQH